jgi:superfamily II DNA/RNA helicase
VAFGLDELQRALLTLAPLSGDCALDPLAIRIRDVLKDGTANKKSELPPLVRHFLIRESSRAGRNLHVRVPKGAGWPEASDWARHGIRSLSVDEGELDLIAEEWRPDWLTAGESGVFADAFADSVVRVHASCLADPFITDATGHTHYSCPGQREAVRAAFLMPPGSTLLVNLPTGSGKSLAGHAPALVNKQEGNLTVFVVPTVALAIDQARQMAVYLKKSFGVAWPLAWHGGTSVQERTSIRERLQAGTQRIVFTSPEALLTSLLRTTETASRAGILRYLVIDEAHLVTQWGDEFRPAFQALAGVRSALLREAPNGGFRTLLLSATFTSAAVDSISTLFGPPDTVQLVSAVHLRPEPRYWAYRAGSAAEKKHRVLTALRHAPRPFILYVTERAEVAQWLTTLRIEAGLTRIEAFHGGTGNADRERILQRWIANEIDGVVATSAFGVGIDKSDVRTVVHATIPETLDRFYQEVGRGGRDGCASVSLVIFDDTDWAKPQRLARAKIISDELGLNRWRALFHSCPHEPNAELVAVDLEAVPQHATGSNEFNVDWNMRTLLLLCRAGLIRLEIDSEDSESAVRNAEFSSSSPLAAMARVRVRILDHGHLLEDVWRRRVAPARSRSYEAAVYNLKLMRNLLIDRREVGQTLAELYRIRSSDWPVDVTRVCGGCAADQYHGSSREYQMPVPAAIHQTVKAETYVWRSRFPWLDSDLVYLFYEGDDHSDQTHRHFVELASWLIANSQIRELACARDASIRDMQQWHSLYRRSPDGVIVHRFLDEAEEPYSPLGRLSVLRLRDAQLIEQVRNLVRPLHIVVCHADTRDPVNTQRLLRQTAQSSADLADVLESLSR